MLEELCKTTKSNVEEAIKYLSERMEIPDEVLLGFRKPEITVLERVALFIEEDGNYVIECCAKYDYEKNAIEIRQDHAKDFETIGHEASHYLHNQINPSVHNQKKMSELNKEYWLRIELRELLGCYGGMSYATYKGQEYGLVADFDFAGTDMTNFESMINALLGHSAFRAHKQAELAYGKYGDGLFPALCRLTPEESFTEVPRMLPIDAKEKFYLPIAYKTKGFVKQIQKFIRG